VVKPRILCVIPARKNSKRLKNKNKLDFCGKPMVQWAIEAAIDSNVLNPIIVSTDDEDILELAYSYFPSEMIQPHRCPKILSRGGKFAVRNVCGFVMGLYGTGEEFCLIEPTNPLITPRKIREAYRDFVKSGQDYLIATHKGQDIGFHFVKTRRFLDEYSKNFYGEKIKFWETLGVDIDTREDFDEAVKLFVQRQENPDYWGKRLAGEGNNRVVTPAGTCADTGFLER